MVWVMSPRTLASAKRLGKGIVLSSLALAVDAVAQALAGNSFGLPVSASTVVIAYVVPMLYGVEKWANWETAQP